MAEMAKYCFTVDQLLREAGRRRSSKKCDANNDADHVVELQFVVAALNTLPNGTYWRDDWKGQLVDFFNKDINLDCIPSKENQEKRVAVKRFIDGKPLSETQLEFVQRMKRRWLAIRSAMTGFERFENAVDRLLKDVSVEI